MQSSSVKTAPWESVFLSEMHYKLCVFQEGERDQEIQHNCYNPTTHEVIWTGQSATLHWEISSFILLLDIYYTWLLSESWWLQTMSLSDTDKIVSHQINQQTKARKHCHVARTLHQTLFILRAKNVSSFCKSCEMRFVNISVRADSCQCKSLNTLKSRHEMEAVAYIWVKELLEEEQLLSHFGHWELIKWLCFPIECDG